MERKNSAGFGLLEALLVLSLAAIFVAGALEFFRERTNLKREILKLKYILENSQQEALSLGHEIKVELDSNSVNTSSAKQKSYDLPQGLQFKPAPRTIRFFGSGVNSPATVFLHSDSSECRLVLSLRGRIRVKCS